MEKTQQSAAVMKKGLDTFLQRIRFDNMVKNVSKERLVLEFEYENDMATCMVICIHRNKILIDRII